MAWEIVWTEPALEDLQKISECYVERNSKAGEKIVHAIVERVELLASVPLLGAPLPRDPSQNKRQVISGKYRIIYRVMQESQRIEVLTVWHGSRQDPELPE